MATIDFKVDILAKRLVTSLLDDSRRELPKLTQGDSPTLRIWFLQPTGTFNNPYTYIATTGITAQVTIGPRAGNSVAPYHTSQSVWTPSGDLANPYHEAILPMNTAAITTLLGSAGSNNSAFFEIQMISGGVPTTVYSEQCTIIASVFKEGGITVPASPTPLSVEVANVTYVQVDHVGDWILTSAIDPTKKGRIYWGDDNELHVEPIVP